FRSGDHAVGRVIARPFAGEIGAFYRLSDQRHDFSLIPPTPNLLSQLQRNGIRTYSIGKVIDLFAEVGFDDYTRTHGNADGLMRISECPRDIPTAPHSFLSASRIDTDQLFGHRNDVDGYALCLKEIDDALPHLFNQLQD